MKKFVCYLCIVVLGIAIGCFFTYCALNDNIDISKINSSVVYIEATNGIYKSNGSGFVYKISNGTSYIITSYHVIDGYIDIFVYNESKESVEATLIGYDEDNDIAVLGIEEGLELESAPIGDSSKIKVGDFIFIAGSPSNIDYISTITSGIVSSRDRKIKYDNSLKDIDVIQIDAPINLGNSGGPLVDKKGNVIGIVMSREVDLNGIGFAIPINRVMDVVRIIENGEKSRINLGAVMASSTNKEILETYKIDSNGINGVVLVKVNEDGILYNYGLKQGDVIVKFNGIDILNVEELKKELKKYKIKDKVKLEYYSSDILKEIIIELK